jgi:hypothetical protein
MKQILIAAIALIVAVLPACAWNHTGHAIVAELAWRNLSPAKQNAISILLRQHPHYASLLATNVPYHVDTNEWAFLNAAVWPDMVRPARSGGREKSTEITKYHHSAWHYINIPYVWPADAALIAASSFTVPETNILWALTNTINTLKDSGAAPPDKAVDLCWVMHLVGDLHQPLHAATLLSEAYPHGDQGGNLLGIADSSNKPLNLHSFWDQLLDTGGSYELISKITDNIAAAPQYNPRNLAEYEKDRTIRSWADESFAAAVAFAYAEGQLRFVDWKKVEAGDIPAADVPHLKATYVINANDIARRRVALAGQRLADILKKNF